jgi:2-polyprenyl-3-methyl-5-hydroxy-6-metoxy-1,4-benzoquinol methylase
MSVLASLEDWTLGLIAADPAAPEIGGTANYSLTNCLDFARKTVPAFDDKIRGKRVLDYGCGFG